jgi:calcineurin-like phosphoesterase family protein
MDEAIIANINAIVGCDDTLWHLGDFAFGDFNSVKRYRDRLHCRNIRLIIGNHDKNFVRNIFDECYDGQVLIKAEGQDFFLNHLPLLSWYGPYRQTIMCHGHVHGNMRRNPLVRACYDQMQICDVGVDGPDGPNNNEEIWNHKFKPWSVAQLRKFMETKTNHDQKEEIRM